MASKKTETTKAKPAAPKQTAKAPAKAKPAAKPAVAAGPRHPRARVVAAHGSKEALAQKLAPLLARTDEDAGTIEARLKTASNQQLLRLVKATEMVKKKWGSRDKLIDAISAQQKKAKDQDFRAKLDAMTLPRLVDLASRA